MVSQEMHLFPLNEPMHSLRKIIHKMVLAFHNSVRLYNSTHGLQQKQNAGERFYCDTCERFDCDTGLDLATGAE